MLDKAKGIKYWIISYRDKAFPNERKLNSLPAIGNRRWLANHVVPELMRIRWWKRWQVRGMRHEVAHYAPEQSCSLRLDLQLADETGRERAWTLFGKTYYNLDGERTHRNMRALSRLSRRLRHLGSAQALHYDVRLNLLWQEGVEGEDLFSLAARGRCDDAVMRRVASALAELHACRLPDTPTLHLRDTLDSLQQRIALLAQVRPDLAPRYRALEQALRFRAPAPAPAATLHGDLHSKNILVNDSRVVLIDLDDLQSGPVAKELGSWLACAAYRDLLRELPIEADRHAAWVEHDALLRHYRAAAGAGAASAAAVDW